MTTVTCAQCEAVLDESPQAPADQRAACPHCGSTARLFKVELSDTVEVKSSLSMKAKEAGRGKPFLEQKVGDDFYRKAQKWVKRLVRIDRRNDQYTEHVVDHQTNETIHHCDEPLSAHRGHGTEKGKTFGTAAQRPPADEPSAEHPGAG